MNDQIAKLQNDAKTNESLKKALVAAGGDLDKIVAVAKEHGYSFSKDELQAAMSDAKASAKPGKLSEKELEAATGGSFVTVTEGAVAQVVVSVEA